MAARLATDRASELLTGARKVVGAQTVKRLLNSNATHFDAQYAEEARDDVRDREDALVDVLKSLKALYNHHFMLVKDADDSHRPIDRSRIDDVFLRVAMRWPPR